MKAVVYDKYGLPDVLELQEVDKPEPAADEVLVKVKAVSLNASDWEFLTGSPMYTRVWGIRKPHIHILGSDIAGQIEDVGSKVEKFKVGDEVFGDIFEHWGGFAEYVCVPEKMLTIKPTTITFEEAAAIPQSALIALQGLRDKGEILEEQKVLINGAGGGAGTFAIQIANFYGAEVTGVDSKQKLDKIRSIGADYAIDYKEYDFTRNGIQYNVILDLVASHSIFDYKRALTPCGKYIMVGGSVSYIVKTLFFATMVSMSGSKKMSILAHKPNQGMGFIIDLIESGNVKPVIDKVYKLSEIKDAMQYLGNGDVIGKLIVTM